MSAPETSVPALRPDPRGPGLLLGEGVRVAEGVVFGAHVVVHAGTVIGEGCAIDDHVVLGKRPRLARGSSAAGGPVEDLVIDAGVRVCAGAVVCAGARVESGAILGRGSVVDNDVLIGARVKVQTNVYLTAFTVLEDDVFVGPGACTTNDDTMGRHGPETPLRGAILRRACRVGGGAVLTPGVEIGEEAFVAAGAVVTRDVPPRAVVMGVPARVVREVPEGDLLERWR
jgi:acetyltransferase-like isoleucine patch superfamily enzyme